NSMDWAWWMPSRPIALGPQETADAALFVPTAGDQQRCFVFYPTKRTSTLDDGLESVGFQLLARGRCGLIVRVRPDLNAIILVRAGRNDVRREFFLLQGLRKRQRVILMEHGSDLKHDCAFRNQRTVRGAGRFCRLSSLGRSSCQIG